MATPSSILTDEMRQQAIGRESIPATQDIEKGAIIKFAQAIGDDNPLFNDEEAARRGPNGGLIAPPTFLRSVRAEGVQLPFELPLTRTLDGGSDWEYFEPVRPGDSITTVTRITNFFERTGSRGLMVLTIFVTTYRNQFDHVAATQTSTSIKY